MGGSQPCGDCRQLAATALAATALVLRLNTAQLCALQHAPAALSSSEATSRETKEKTHTSRENDEEDDENDEDDDEEDDEEA